MVFLDSTLGKIDLTWFFALVLNLNFSIQYLLYLKEPVTRTVSRISIELPFTVLISNKNTWDKLFDILGPQLLLLCFALLDFFTE